MQIAVAQCAPALTRTCRNAATRQQGQLRDMANGGIGASRLRLLHNDRGETGFDQRHHVALLRKRLGDGSWVDGENRGVSTRSEPRVR